MGFREYLGGADFVDVGLGVEALDLGLSDVLHKLVRMLAKHDVGELWKVAYELTLILRYVWNRHMNSKASLPVF